MDEQVTGFYNQGDRVRFCGSEGAFWGAMWSLFFGGLFVTVPVVGPVVALGYIGVVAIGVLEGAVAVGSVSAIAAALYGMGIPKDSVLQYPNREEASGAAITDHQPKASFYHKAVIAA